MLIGKAFQRRLISKAREEAHQMVSKSDQPPGIFEIQDI